MPLETANFISGLDESWPTSPDELSQGDDHLRLIKDVLKTQFPGVGGDGFSEAINSTEDEINYSQGLTGNIQDQIDALSAGVNNNTFASGTVMVFRQQTAPVGWTKQTDSDDRMLVSESGGGGGANGGSESPTEMDLVHKHSTKSHTLTIDEMPSHNHSMGLSRDEKDGTGDVRIWQDGTSLFTGNEGGDQSHNHGDTFNVELYYNPLYTKVIFAMKD